MINSLDWVKGYRDRREGVVPHTYSARYSLSDLTERGLLDRQAVNGMLHDTQLQDYTWHMIWAEDYPTMDDELINRFNDVDGYVVFLHGVTGSNMIWEDLPGMVVRKNRRLVALVADHNGFGETPFAKHRPAIEECNPVAAMHAAECWFDLLGLRRATGEPRPKVVNFVGHSMGGAALFFLDESRWRYGEQTRVALAPALLLRDEMHRVFFNTIGFGVGLVARMGFLEEVENVVSWRAIEVLTDGATKAVYDEHIRVYETTAKSVTARAWVAMGVLHQKPQAHSWDLMQVVLGHRDLLVGVSPMMDLLQELNFHVDQVRVVMGTHYLFSVGEQFQRVHTENRQLVLDDVLELHERALKLQRSG